MHRARACTGKRRKTEQERLIEEHFRDADSGADVDADEDRGSSDDGSGDDVGSGDDDGLVQPGQPSVVGAGPEGPSRHRGDAGDAAAAAGRKRTRMLEGREEASGDLFARNVSVAAQREMPLGVRAGEAEEEEGGAARPRSGRGRGMGVWYAICRFVT